VTKSGVALLAVVSRRRRRRRRPCTDFCSGVIVHGNWLWATEEMMLLWAWPRRLKLVFIIKNYRYRLSIISPFFGLSNYRFLLRKLSIFEQNTGISTKSKYFFEKFNI
jgi:hypothetical protein